ncbi:glycerol acyltransferase, partial [Streptomyces sp. MBT57]|nr:glycerol acyltransferase [Streptomyces sp. MBT57]
MADAKVIPFDDDRSRSGSASRPARRRTGAGSGGGRGDGSTAPVSALPGGRLPESPSDGAEGAQDPQRPQEEAVGGVGAPADAGGGWDRRIAGGLAFLRRRVTGDYEVDEFGYDKE